MDIKKDCDKINERAYHESGHIVFANLMGIPISYAIICDTTEKDDKGKPTAHTEETWIGKLKLKFLKKFSPEKCIIYFLSGGKVESFYCKNNEKHPRDDQEIFSCLGNNQKLIAKAERYIDDKLLDPIIRAQIEGIAHILLDKKCHKNSEFLKIIN